MLLLPASIFSFSKYLINLFFIWQEEKIDNSLEFLILASDGLWDVVTNEVYHDFSFLFTFYAFCQCTAAEWRVNVILPSFVSYDF